MLNTCLLQTYWVPCCSSGYTHHSDHLQSIQSCLVRLCGRIRWKLPLSLGAHLLPGSSNCRPAVRVCVHIPSSYTDTGDIGFRPPHDLTLTWWPLWRLRPQTQSHSDVMRARISTYEFEEGTQFNLYHPPHTLKNGISLIVEISQFLDFCLFVFNWGGSYLGLSAGGM